MPEIQPLYYEKGRIFLVVIGDTNLIDMNQNITWTKDGIILIDELPFSPFVELNGLAINKPGNYTVSYVSNMLYNLSLIVTQSMIDFDPNSVARTSISVIQFDDFAKQIQQTTTILPVNDPPVYGQFEWGSIIYPIMYGIGDTSNAIYGNTQVYGKVNVKRLSGSYNLGFLVPIGSIERSAIVAPNMQILTNDYSLLIDLNPNRNGIITIIPAYQEHIMVKIYYKESILETYPFKLISTIATYYNIIKQGIYRFYVTDCCDFTINVEIGRI